MESGLLRFVILGTNIIQEKQKNKKLRTGFKHLSQPSVYLEKCACRQEVTMQALCGSPALFWLQCSFRWETQEIVRSVSTLERGFLALGGIPFLSKATVLKDNLLLLVHCLGKSLLQAFWIHWQCQQQSMEWHLQTHVLSGKAQGSVASGWGCLKLIFLPHWRLVVLTTASATWLTWESSGGNRFRICICIYWIFPSLVLWDLSQIAPFS